LAEHEYLTVAEALSTILNAVSVLPAEDTPLEASLGRVLAEPVRARDSLPPFANASMDGYAVRARDVANSGPENPVSLPVVADIAAGTTADQSIPPGTVARIMTGAPLPRGADAVVPVEDTSEPWRDPRRPLPASVAVKRAVSTGAYVRYPGEDVKQGAVVLPAGRLVRPQEIGLMAALGVASLSVIRRPRVGVLATGDELIPVDQPLTSGKIRNSNGYTQTAQVTSLGAVPVSLGVAGDSEAAVRERLDAGLKAGVDLFVSSAGVSVGAYDVVKAVLDEDGSVAFWRVRMRPGKPLAFGTYGSVPYLGLPGNPVSAMVSFERFARPAILKMGGRTELDRPKIWVTVQEAIQSDGRESYIRAVVERSGDEYVAQTTGQQGSHMMTSLTSANALVIVPEGVLNVQRGEQLQALMIDWPETVF
jgi:molybdopterin molybdotransferase